MQMNKAFAFSCKACGQCCTYIHGTPLKSYDIYKLARRLGKSPEELVGHYLQLVESHFLIQPVVKTARDGFCPFLEDGLCSVHTDKPFACRLYPVEQDRRGDRYEYRFVLDAYEPCGTEQNVTLGKWLDGVGKEELDYARWFDDLYDQLEVRILHSDPPWKKRKELGRFLLNTVFLAYDPARAYRPQFEANAVKALGSVNKALRE